MCLNYYHYVLASLKLTRQYHALPSTQLRKLNPEPSLEGNFWLKWCGTTHDTMSSCREMSSKFVFRLCPLTPEESKQPEGPVDRS